MWVDLVQQSKEYSDLYTRCPVVGRKLLVDVEPYNISDAIPDEEEIHVALHRLRRQMQRGPLPPLEAYYGYLGSSGGRSSIVKKLLICERKKLQQHSTLPLLPGSPHQPFLRAYGRPPSYLQSTVC